MFSTNYEIPAECAESPLSGPLEAAEDALIRLDERLRKHPLAEGWAARQHFGEALASLGLEGELVHLEDLVLRDASMDVRTPTHEVGRAMAVVRARRLMAGHAGSWALTPDGLEALRGRLHRPASAGEGSPLLHDPEWSEDDRFARWRGILRDTGALPATLAAVVAYDAWLAIDPFQRDGWVGRQLVAAELRRRDKARHHLPALSVGLRQLRMGDLRCLAPRARITALLKGVEATAAAGIRDLERLTLARELMDARLKARRASSHLPQLADLFLSSPIVTVPMAAKALKVSGQAANRLVKELAGSIREITERRRYRAWGIL